MSQKLLTKDLSCICKCKFIFVGKKCNSDQWWNNNKCLCECKKRHICEKDYAWNSATCSSQNGKYLASIMDDSTIIFDEIIDTDVDAKLKDGAKPNKEETNFKTKLIKHKMILSISKVLIQIILK